MQKIRISNTITLDYFDIPYEWIEKKGIAPNLNDLESSAERGVITGELFRNRIAELPSSTLKFLTDRKQSEIWPLLKVIRPQKVYIFYFDNYENMYVQRPMYIPKPKLSFKTIPKDEDTGNIVYEAFDLSLIGYRGV